MSFFPARVDPEFAEDPYFDDTFEDNPIEDDLKPERVQEHLAAVLEAEQELNWLERILSTFNMDRIVRFLQLLLKVFRGLGWIPEKPPEEPAEESE